MSQIVTIGRQLADMIKRNNADYIEAHLEESQTSHIAYRGRELESVGRSIASGGNVRAMVKGGWGFVSFNDLNDLPGRVEMAVKRARLVGNTESNLSLVEPAVDRVLNELDKNPVTISLDKKKGLLDEYNEIIWETPKLQTSIIGYGDGYKKSIFVNSQGSYIEQERADIAMRLTAIATEGNEVQQVGLSLGSRGDFTSMQGLHQQIRQMAQKAVELLSAPQIKGVRG
jgi:TldD protein